MRFLVILVTLMTAIQVWAQKNTKPAAPVSAASSSYSSGGAKDNNVSVNLGFASTAFNFGATYEKTQNDLGMGGYFFMQSDKEKDKVKVVRQVTSFGGLLKMHLVNNNQFDAYFAPGFGLHMIKDVTDGSGKKSDKTTFGPMTKIGGVLKFTPTMAAGIERTAISNWFDDLAPSEAEFFSAVLAIEL